MTPTEIDSYLDEVEKFAERKFRYRADITFLLGQSAGRKEAFDQVVFYAKFLSKAYDILKKSGTGGEEVARLSAEFAAKLEESASLLRGLLEGAPAESARDFSGRFLAQSREGVAKLLELLYELSWIKNYSIGRESRT